jgi:hypothetical protein
MRSTPEGKLAFAATLIGIAGAGAMMIWPTKTWIGWTLLAIGIGGLLALGVHHFWPQLTNLSARLRGAPRSPARPGRGIIEATSVPVQTVRVPETPSARTHITEARSAVPTVQFDERLTALFDINLDNRTLSLKFLPDRPSTRNSDAVLALLYGYREIFNLIDVRKSVMDSSIFSSDLYKSDNSILRLTMLASRITADSGGSRPRIRDDVAHHSDLISLGVPR